MNILSICSEPTVMNVLRLVVLFIKIIRVAVPIALIVTVMLKFAGAATKHDDNLLNKATKSIVPNAIAAVLIFLIPSFVDIVVRISFPNSDYTKCISGISIKTVNEAYNLKMDSLIANVESSLEYTDYSTAASYLQYIKDADKKEEYEQKLEAIKVIIDEKNEQKSDKKRGENKYAKVNYSNFTWTYYKKNSGPLTNYETEDFNSYAIWGPENVKDLNGVSLPLMVWLHGSGETIDKAGKDTFLNSGLLKVMSNWSSYGLENIPAIIVAPQASEGWWSGHIKNNRTIRALIKYAQEYYKIDSSKIVFIGHSMGGNGVIEMTWELKDINFYAVIPMSTKLSSYKSSEGGKEFYSKINFKGYGEMSVQQKFFDWIGQPNNFTYYAGVAHGKVPEKAMTEDLNKDGVSDLMYWLFKDELGLSNVEEEKVITHKFFIGDSRTVGLFRYLYPDSNADRDDLASGKATVGDETWSCMSAMGIDWMKSTGIPNIEDQLGKGSALIILMGVNGYQTEQYVSYFNEKLPEWNKKGVRVYFVSVMPCSGSYAHLNKKSEEFNAEIKKIKGLYYIDAYTYLNETGFYSADGLHYAGSTHTKIYNYILDNL